MKGKKKTAESLLFHAARRNPFVFDYILQLDNLPMSPPSYLWDSPEEALAYVHNSMVYYLVFKKMEVFDFMLSFYQKNKRRIIQLKKDKS